MKTPMQADLIIRADQPKSTISPDIYGHFIEHLGSCIYDGIWVGPDSKIPNIRGLRKDVVNALKELEIPVLRWPGGCFADQYHWRDGIGPRSSRPKRINNFWGQVIETNAFGTHEFMDLCELVGAKAYLAANVGSGTPAEMVEWLEYLTSDSDSELANLRRKNGREKPWNVPILGIGNESWGCGGSMAPEYYSDVFKRFSTYAFQYSGNRFMKVACGASDSNYKWTETVMSRAANNLDGISLHYYTLPTGDWSKKGLATGFGEKEWCETLQRTLHMDEFIAKHSEVMDKFDKAKRVGLVVDEWGCWYDDDPNFRIGMLGQQNTMRDALVAALNLNIFNRHCDRVKVANLAQMVNVLQSILLTQGTKTIKTPTYYVMELYKPHMGATLLPVEGTLPNYAFGGGSIPALDVCASQGKGGVFLTFANTNPKKSLAVSLSFKGFEAKHAKGRYAAGQGLDVHNTFANPNGVVAKTLTGLNLEAGTLKFDMPPASVAAISVN